MDQVQATRAALANTWAMYFKAHSFHWNVRGHYFHQFHEMFGNLYEDLHGAVDALAEEIRAMNEMAPASLDEIVGPSSITFTAPPSCEEMVAQLAADNETVVNALAAANVAAVEAKNDGLQNFLQGRIDAHKKWGWMLRATMEEGPDEATEEVKESPAERRMEAPAEMAPAAQPRKAVAGGFLRAY